MQMLCFDKHAIRPVASFRLMLLHSEWHVVGNGYFCRVTDPEEGRRVMATRQGPQEHTDSLR